MKDKVISLHSSRGGTGKTIIATNLAAIYAKRGLNIALLDLDFRAPVSELCFRRESRNQSSIGLMISWTVNAR